MGGRRRLGIMGGTFDPIHLGHLVAASEVAYRFDLDEVVFVPAGSPWQKSGVSPAEDRLAMTQIATGPDARFSVSRVDVDRAGPTYTVDTLRDIRAERGHDVDLFFITGADALESILTWQSPLEVLRQAHLVGVSRPGHALVDPGLPADAVSLVEVPALAISSTDIRRRVAQSRPITYLVPVGVERHILERGLYADGGTVQP